MFRETLYKKKLYIEEMIKRLYEVEQIKTKEEYLSLDENALLLGISQGFGFYIFKKGYNYDLTEEGEIPIQISDIEGAFSIAEERDENNLEHPGEKVIFSITQEANNYNKGQITTKVKDITRCFKHNWNKNRRIRKKGGMANKLSIRLNFCYIVTRILEPSKESEKGPESEEDLYCALQFR